MSPVSGRHAVRAKFGRLRGKFVSQSKKKWVEEVVAARRRRAAETSVPAPAPVPVDFGGYGAGRRVVELYTLAHYLWCNECKIPLSLRSIESEIIHGLGSCLLVRCTQCQFLHKVLTNKIHSDDAHCGTQRYDVNFKAAVAILDGGSGEAQMNTILSALNVPTLSTSLLKRYERLVGVAIESTATESCREAIALEKQLTIAAKQQEWFLVL